MSRGDLFLIGVIALQSCAGLSYAWDDDAKRAIVWLGVAVSNLAFLFLPKD